jgi:two-component system sensor histidine kinase BarA
MSYRSIKRHLGETHLERKFLLLFGAFLFLLISLGFLACSLLTDNLVKQQNKTTAERLVATSLLAHHWEKVNFAGQPLDSDRDKDWIDMLRSLGAGVQGNDYQCAFLRPADSDDPAQPSDDFEADLLEEFALAPPGATEQNDSKKPRERLLNNGGQYAYYRPIYAQASCIICHRVQTGPADLAEGQLIAVAKVTISNADTHREQVRNWCILLAIDIVICFLAITAAYFVVRYVIVKPLKHLRDVSDAVSRGNLEQRAEIHTADEFEELAVAFNRMLAHLIAAQEELRRLNVHLDLKVDELAQANMRLFELNRLKSDFLATMSHELRTPLNSIIGFSDVLSSIKSLDDKQHRYVQNIQKSGKMLLDMINDILDLAKIESGKMELRPSDFRIEHVLHAQCDMARPLAERKNLDLDIVVDGDLPELFQDQGKVQQVLNNLLSNAIKFTPDGGRIVISARRSADDELLLTVADTGVGISDEDQAHLFEKFRQGRTVMPGGDAMTREYSGTGLGLSIVKELCKLLGGDVSVESELGKGSTFTVRLPWQVPVAAAVAPEGLAGEVVDEGSQPSRDELASVVAGSATGHE